MLLLALLLLAADAPERITRPDWAELPDAAELDRLYPAGAKARQLEGRAVIECSVAVDGALSRCVVISETPAGEGFGEATVQAMREFEVDKGLVPRGRITADLVRRLSEAAAPKVQGR